MKNVRSGQIVSIGIIFCLFMVAGCASFSDNAYKTLDIQATLYESVKQIANEMPSDTWDEQEKTEIEKLAKRYRIAYHMAVESLIAYEDTKSKEHMELVTTALENLKKIVQLFDHLINRWSE